MLRQVGRTPQKYLSFLFLPEQLVQLVLPDPQVAQDQLDPLAQQVPVAPPVQMVVMEAMVVQDPLVVKGLRDLQDRPDPQGRLVLLDHKVRLVVLHSSTILAQQQQIATPVQVR